MADFQQNPPEIPEDDKDRQILELQEELRRLREELTKVPEEEKEEDEDEEIKIVGEVVKDSRKRSAQQNEQAPKRAKMVPDACGCSTQCSVTYTVDNQKITIKSITILAGILNAKKQQANFTLPNLLFYAQRIDADESDKIQALKAFAFCPTMLNIVEKFEKWSSALEKFRKMVKDQLGEERKLIIMALYDGNIFKSNPAPYYDEELPEALERIRIREDLEVHIVIESKNYPKFFEKLVELLRKRNVADTTITLVPMANTSDSDREEIERLIGSLKIHDKIHITSSPLTSKMFAALLW